MTVLILEGACLGAVAGMLLFGGGENKEWENRGEDYRAGHQMAAYEVAVKSDSGSEKVVALTFDDGPHEIYTAQLLDGLKERGVKATFFLMGQNIEGKEELVQRMKQEGHLIGNHSYQHIQLTKAGERTVCEAVERTEEIIEGITGERSRYLRPPYGDWNENLECQLDMTTVFWSVDSLDWKLKNTEKIVENVEKKVRNGDIILMHDIFPTSVEAALVLVDRLEKKGYQFVTVEELIIE